DGREAVDAVVAGRVLPRLVDGSDVTDPDDAPVVYEHGQLTDLVGDLGALPDRQFAQAACWGADRGGLADELHLHDALTDDVRPQAERLDAGFTQLQLEHPVAPAERRDTGDSVELGEVRRDVVLDVFTKVLERVGPGDRIGEERLALVLEFARDVGLDARCARAERQILLDGRDAFRQLEPREVQVRVAREPHLDRRKTFLRYG